MRQYNYYAIKSIRQFLNFSNHDIYLFSHVNECNSVENNIINNYLKSNKIEFIQIRSNLVKRLHIYPSFFPLYKGPTQVIKFNTVESFYSFFTNNYVKNKFLPLLVYWNNKTYSPEWFHSYLKKKLVIAQKKELNKIIWLKSSINILQSNLIKIIMILNFKKILLLFLKMQKKNY